MLFKRTYRLPDTAIVDIQNEAEVLLLTDEFRCSREELVDAAKVVGSFAGRLREHFATAPSRRPSLSSFSRLSTMPMPLEEER